MDREGKILRLGAAVIVCATLLRLAGGGFQQVAAYLPEGEDLLSLAVFLQSGYVLRWEEKQEETLPVSTEPQPEPTQPTPAIPTPQPLTLTAQQLQAVQLQNGTQAQVDILALAAEDITWQLRGETPTELILHTHATESYTQTEDYTESTGYRTLDEGYNMVSVGELVALRLEEAGIRVIHDRTAYDYPSYSGSYNQARQAVTRYLAENPSIRLVLDLHRDAMEDGNGNQLSYTRETDRGTAAKLMIVCGSDTGGLDYPNWRENLGLGIRLQAVLEQQTPGLCRPLSLRTGRYNQDLFSNMLLIEVGSAGNTRQQALVAAEELAEAIIAIADGIEIEG